METIKQQTRAAYGCLAANPCVCRLSLQLAYRLHVHSLSVTRQRHSNYFVRLCGDIQVLSFTFLPFIITIK